MVRAYSSVVEHCVDIAGVGSSILPTPTIRQARKASRPRRLFVHLVPVFALPDGAGTSGPLHRLSWVAFPQPRINAIATGVPTSECDATYHAWAARQLEGRREAQLLERMMKRSGIGRRYTVLSSNERYRSE